MKRVVPRDLTYYLAASCPRNGLASTQVVEFRGRFGPNDILGCLRTRRWGFMTDAFRDPMIWFLVIVSLAYMVLGQLTESFVLLLAIAPIVGMDAYLHRRTSVTTSSLAGRLATLARPVRDGKELLISTDEVVVGDVVKVSQDEYFPADGVLIDGANVQVDESSLSGEAFPVGKKPFILPPEQLGKDAQVDEIHWTYAGTRLLTGKALVRVIYTGRRTLYGEIVSLITSESQEKTPLQVAIQALVLALVGVSAAICVILGVVRLVQGFGWIDAFISSATLAVAALPEEFPIVYSFFLGVGVYRMAKRKVLVKRAVAVENIGRITCICTDKTGTLTEGELRVKEIIPATMISKEELIRNALLASSSGGFDPVDTAISELVTRDAESMGSTILARFPFTEDRKRETVAIKINQAVHVAMKGAPEAIFRCVNLSDWDLTQWTERMERLASSGLKVIACASQEMPMSAWVGAEPTNNYQFAGLLAFEDPPRAGVQDAIRWCRDQGIRVLMITGDHQRTAEGVAAEIGLNEFGEFHSINAEKSDDLEKDVLTLSVNIIARATPREKLRVVQALKKAGEIVAVTGDGVNDAPALQTADISIAMGQRGTQSAREVSSIVLMNDDFSSIVQAIAEGRQLFRNLQMSFQYLLTIHLPLVFTAMLIPLAGYPILYQPIHIVWLEMIIHPTALLVFQELPQGKVLPKYDVQGGRFFSRRQWVGIIACGTLVALVILATYYRSLGPGRDQVLHARAMALLVLVFASGALTAGLSRLRTWTSRIVVLGTLLSAIVLLNTSFFAPFFLVESPHLDDFLIASASGLVVGALASVMGRPSQRSPKVALPIQASKS